ncbi:MAG: M48 family metalloprotease [Nitrospinota bacterium]|nr:M48 family metalloprotease [Nitrospinota bacterium]
MKTEKSGALSRRDFLLAATAASAYVATGCATNPVTGESQLMLMDKDTEIQMDRENSPHQISADYGPNSDANMSEYISHVGVRLSSLSHRPDMPYTYRVVDATYINAYAFPGGTISATRGIMLALENEASLAALLGHEIGHVNARHTASRMSKALLTQLAVAGLVVAAGNDKNMAPLAAGLGALGAGILLAKYSRDDERQADGLGMEYMVRAGYNPVGMVNLMEALMSMSKEKPSVIEMMFASHPMSEERYKMAKDSLSDQFSDLELFKVGKERHMDSTASLRKIKPAIEMMQKGEQAMRKEKYSSAETLLAGALQKAPNDYAGLLMMAKCQLAQKKNRSAQDYAQRASQVKPSEPQSNHVLGMSLLFQSQFALAYRAFDKYETLLPGNPNTTFMKGLSAEGMGDMRRAADEYMKYARVDNSSEQGRYATSRLLKWGYIRQSN